MVETEGVRTAGIAESDFRKGYEAQTPLGRIGQARRHCSGRRLSGVLDSGWITGETFYISGGVRLVSAASEQQAESKGESFPCHAQSVSIKPAIRKF